MNKRDLNTIIIKYLRQYNADRIGVFGSYARGEEDASSDLDLLVSFRDALGLLQLVKIERELSELTGIKVDLLTEGALKNKKIRKYISKDLQIIYGS